MLRLADALLRTRLLLCRNVDPTTTLLKHINAPAYGMSGVLAIDSNSITLLRGNAPEKRLLLPLTLAGFPTAIEHLRGPKWVLADSMAGLHIVNLAEQCSLQRVTAQVPFSVANALCCVADSESEQGNALQRTYFSLQNANNSNYHL